MSATQTPAYRMLIGGALHEAPGRFEVLNPADRTLAGEAPNCSDAQLDAAVSAARDAQAAWAATPIERRGEILRACAEAVRANAKDLAAILTREHGKPLSDAAGEVMATAYWIDSVTRLELPVVRAAGPRAFETRRAPIGVVAAIAPWNFPLLLAAWKIAPALYAGNAVVLKPSPYTPLTTLKVGEVLADILPTGVLNVISGDDAVGPRLTAHPGVDKISFTGSTQTGRKVMASAADGLKRVTLELGGNDPAIVLPDADVEKIAEPVFWSAFRNSGQICAATKRLYVHESLYEALAAALVRLAGTVKVGDGAESGTTLGPVQNARQYGHVRSLIEDCHARGFGFLVGGEIGETKGYALPVSIVDDPSEDSRVVQEEAFGPLLPMLRYRDLDEVVARANASPFGLGACIWTSDPEAAKALAGRLAAGTVWINSEPVPSPDAPFGGFKQSGVGVENGLEGLLEYTVAQTTFVGTIR